MWGQFSHVVVVVVCKVAVYILNSSSSLHHKKKDISQITPNVKIAFNKIMRKINYVCINCRVSK